MIELLNFQGRSLRLFEVGRVYAKGRIRFNSYSPLLLLFLRVSHYDIYALGRWLLRDWQSCGVILLINLILLL